MREWNVVISVHEHGFRKAFDVFGGFGTVEKTEFFNVLLMKARDVPFMLEELRERTQRDPGSLSFLARLVPVTESFVFQKKEEFEEKTRRIVLEWAARLAGKSFHVRIRRRGFKGRLSSPEEERLLDAAVLEELERIGTPGRIQFDHPDAVIAIETIGTWAGLLFWTREQLGRYPFVRV